MGSSKRCGRGKDRYSLMNARHMHYFSEEEKSNLAVWFEFGDGNGCVRVVSNTTGMPLPAGKLLFVWSTNKIVYVAAEKEGVVAHTRFEGALPVLHAGELVIDRNGELVEVRPKSGHYRPSSQDVGRFREWLGSELEGYSLDLTSVRWKGIEEDWDH